MAAPTAATDSAPSAWERLGRSMLAEFLGVAGPVQTAERTLIAANSDFTDLWKGHHDFFTRISRRP